MATLQLPLSRVIDVTIDRQTIFPTRNGFGTLLILISDTSGPLDANNRTKIYSSPAEVATDYLSATEPYKAALAAFEISPRPIFIKLGWRDSAEPVLDELDAIELDDSDWYGLAFTKELRDTADAESIASWVEARTKLHSGATNDVLTEDESDVTHYAAAVKLQGYDRTSAFYHTDADEYPDVKWLTRLLRTDFSGRDTAMTLKFKRLQGLPTIQKSTSVVTAITGFIPKIGLVDNAGHWANTYVNIAGLDMIVEGNMASGEWADTMHFTDWLQNAIEVRILSLFYNTNKVPYTDKGHQLMVDEVDFALQQGVRNGGLAASTDPETGDVLPAYTIEVDRVSLAPPDRRANRIGMIIKFTGRLAGAVHYGIVEGTVTV